ncbi:MAG: hypothetical protein H8E40_03875 [Chloroflexi bacterium]|nr:hypothetical protein [Chloroflexota bacterium]
MKKPRGKRDSKEKRYPKKVYIPVIIFVLGLVVFSAWLLTEKETVGIPPLCSLIAGGVAFAAAWNSTKSNGLLRSLWFFGVIFFGLGIVAQIKVLFM